MPALTDSGGQEQAQHTARPVREGLEDAFEYQNVGPQENRQIEALEDAADALRQLLRHLEQPQFVPHTFSGPVNVGPSSFDR
jgi:hypothetical protein